MWLSLKVPVVAFILTDLKEFVFLCNPVLQAAPDALVCPGVVRYNGDNKKVLI
jgi:hypothetical protein